LELLPALNSVSLAFGGAESASPVGEHPLGWHCRAANIRPNQTMGQTLGNSSMTGGCGPRERDGDPRLVSKYRVAGAHDGSNLFPEHIRRELSMLDDDGTDHSGASMGPPQLCDVPGHPDRVKESDL